MKLEGKISGPWTVELGRTWQNLETSLGSKRLSVDLSGLDFVDVGRAELFWKMHQKTRADFIADSPLAKYFTEQAMSRFTGNGKKGA
jgi:hypothetical protein